MERFKELGFTEVVKRTFKVIGERDISGYAQMVAYNLLFATAPLLMVLIAGAGAVTRAVNSEMQNPAQPVISWMEDTMPQEATEFLKQPIEAALTQPAGWIFSIGALLALWGARGAVNALIKGLNQAYGIDEDPRSFIKLNLTAIGITLAFVMMLAIGGLVFALGTDFGANIADYIGMAGAFTTASRWLRYPLILVVAVIGLALLHRYGPAEQAPFRWYIPGAVFTIIGGYLATLALSIYFSRGGGYQETYGIFGSVLAFVFWLFVIGFVALIGGVINGVLHEERRIEGTRGREVPASE